MNTAAALDPGVAPRARHFQHFINGTFAASASGATFAKHRPSDNVVVAHIAGAGASEIGAAISAAHQAWDGPWGKMTLEQWVAMVCVVADGATVVVGGGVPLMPPPYDHGAWVEPAI